ncbi:MAG: tryptophan synthase subunit alpha [Omnitrophica WOR_2 bacterium RIFCSPLOWO2_01_FULL_41_12]|nr:MAG: tryptophan synthase subunit alpha [Omnitrophica WOR_2 bacterium RIFCSPLOWO2_01_FULL_41_12]
MNRIERKFKELKIKNKKAFIVFITCGYPDLDTTRKLISEFVRQGVDIIELGVPFSDPLADGPVIQESSQAALKRKTDINAILNLVKIARKNKIDIPIALMSYYNPIFCYGRERFIKKAKASGVDGVIIPDMPPEEDRTFIKLAGKFNIDTIFFLSPTSLSSRIKLIAGVSKGFIYYVSLTGVTGPRKKLSPGLVDNLRRIKKITAKPVCVGFGVSNRRQIKEIYKIADGVIVGSVVIQKIKENINRSDLVKRVGACIKKLH